MSHTPTFTMELLSTAISQGEKEDKFQPYLEYFKLEHTLAYIKKAISENETYILRLNILRQAI